MHLQGGLNLLVCVRVNLREDVPHIGVVGAAERWRSIAAILYTAFTLGFTATCNTHTHTLCKNLLMQDAQFCGTSTSLRAGRQK